MSLETRAILWYGLDLGTEHTDVVAVDDDYDTREAELEPFRCTIGDYLHPDGDVGRYVAIDESVLMTEPEGAVDVPQLAVGTDWHERLRGFCGRRGIEWREPKWLLAVSVDESE